MVERDSLAEVYGSVIKRLPIVVKIEIVPQVYANISLRCDGPECSPELSIVDPNLNILAVFEGIQPAGMVDMQMAYDSFGISVLAQVWQTRKYSHLSYILNSVSCCLDSCSELVLWLIADPRESIGDDRSPYFWVVLSRAGFPKNQPFVRVTD